MKYIYVISHEYKLLKMRCEVYEMSFRVYYMIYLIKFSK